MATGRTKPRWTRVYVDGFDMSGYTRSIGPLEWTYDEVDMTCIGDTVKCYLGAHPQVSVGTLNAVFDNTATVGVHTVLQSAGSIRNVLVAQGIRAVPADGDPCFGGQFEQGAYTTEQSGAVFVNVPFQGVAGEATSRLYADPWGVLLHANAARTSATGVNTAVGFDNYSGGATAKGGFMLYMVTAGDGTATLSVQDAAVNNDGGFATLTGATTGSINCAVKQYGVVIPTTMTVRQYLRWQIAFGSATTVTFITAFMRQY